jgi:hypothetical protein
MVAEKDFVILKEMGVGGTSNVFLGEAVPKDDKPKSKIVVKTLINVSKDAFQFEVALTK